MKKIVFFASKGVFIEQKTEYFSYIFTRLFKKKYSIFCL